MGSKASMTADDTLFASDLARSKAKAARAKRPAGVSDSSVPDLSTSPTDKSDGAMVPPQPPYDTAADLYVTPDLVGTTVPRGQPAPSPAHHLVTVAVYVDVWRQVTAMGQALWQALDSVSSHARDVDRRARMHSEAQRVQTAWERFARMRAWVDGGGLDSGEVVAAMRGVSLAGGVVVDVEPPWETQGQVATRAAARDEAADAERWNSAADDYWG